MTWRTETMHYLDCDGAADAGDTVHGLAAADPSVLLHQAIADGWTFRPAGDWCPEHVPPS